MTNAKPQDRAATGTQAKRPAAMKILSLLLRNVKFGQIQLALPDGEILTFGGKSPDGPAVLKVYNMAFFNRTLRQGAMGFAESYMDGEWSSPDLAKLLILLNSNMTMLQQSIGKNRLTQWINRIIHILRPNTREGAKRNIHAHYDLGNEFYALWLDATMTYSSALFRDSQQTLRDAQNQKYRALAASADIGPNDHVLEIGCGWGGFAEFVAREVGCKVTGITISNEQLAFAKNRIAMAGLQDKVDFKFCDYRDLTEKYDRIVSIEMFEAVGESYWPTYFDQVHACLKPGGKAGLQIITIAKERFDSYRKKTDFIQRYIFPGGMLPSPERLDAEFASADLKLVAREDFAADYARTLAEWRHRFLEVWPEVHALGFDERFRNMWEYYLAYCEAGFTTRSIDVSHFTLMRD
ncbi:MAG: SAM-dependent methyltransferase [Rhodobiaceae bacterium]|nr:SAM-dependent methyltransferase [Rhodobiaceae bacterium]|tara:strand:- start:657 stop:1880 length:1224 start_codon:yes stop_codon:yes gene_type:complete